MVLIRETHKKETIEMARAELGQCTELRSQSDKIFGAYFEVEKTTGRRFRVPPSLSCDSRVSWLRIRITALANWLRLGRAGFLGAICGECELCGQLILYHGVTARQA